MNDAEEFLVLVDEDDREIGTGGKLAVHREGQLHRALSVVIRDPRGRLLLQKRSVGKYHSGGLWTNTCCSHPRPGEPILAASLRRLEEEMGIICPLLPLFVTRYRAGLRQRPDRARAGPCAGRALCGAGAARPGRGRRLCLDRAGPAAPGPRGEPRCLQRLVPQVSPAALGRGDGALGMARACGPGAMAEKRRQGLDRGLTNYGDPEFARYLRRSFAKSMGYSDAMLERPVVGICSSGSDLNNCHRHFPELIEATRRGVLAGGALPMAFPTISLGEIFLSPTSMFLRNLMSMDVEEMLRAQPLDAAVLVGGCDKTVPAQLMGAASADIPVVQLVAGPMMTGRLQRRAAGGLHRLPPLLGPLPGGRDRPGPDRPDRGPAGGHRRHLCRDGHGLDHGLPRRGAGPGAAGHGRDPGRPRRPAARGRGERPPGGTDGGGRWRAAVRDRDARGGGERAPAAAGALGLDQRAHPPHRDRRPARDPGEPAAAERALGHHPGAGRPEAHRGGLHGGLPRRGRGPGRAARAGAAAAPRWEGRHRPEPAGALGDPVAGAGGPGRDPALERPARTERRAGGAVRLPGA